MKRGACGKGVIVQGEPGCTFNKINKSYTPYLAAQSVNSRLDIGAHASFLTMLNLDVAGNAPAASRAMGDLVVAAASLVGAGDPSDGIRVIGISRNGTVHVDASMEFTRRRPGKRILVSFHGLAISIVFVRDGSHGETERRSEKNGNLGYLHLINLLFLENLREFIFLFRVMYSYE